MKNPTSVFSTTFPGPVWRTWRAIGGAILSLAGAATCSAAPANDNINFATAITSAPYTNTEDVTTATTSGGDPYFCYYPYSSVWYTLTRSSNVVVTASTAGSSYDTTLSAFYLAGSLYGVACNDDYNGTLQSQITFTAQAGVIYYFLVASYGTSAGTLVFSEQETPLPPAPANDSFTNATSITALPYTDHVNTVGATTGPEDVDYCYYPYNTVWYALHATQSGLVTASTGGAVGTNSGTGGSDYTAAVQVFTGRPGSFTEVTCGLNGASFSAVAGVTYYFQVSSYSGAAGNLAFAVSEQVVPVNDSITNAIAITTLPYTNTESTAIATTGPEDLYYCTTPYQTVWYTITPRQGIRITASTFGSDYSTFITVLHVTPGGALTYYACGATDVTFDTSVANPIFYFMVGSTYYAGANHLVFSVNEILPPPNDDFNNALAITNLPSTNIVDTELATRATDDPIDCGYDNGPTAWYSLTPANDEFIQISVLPAAHVVDGAVGVYTGTRGALQPVACVYSFGQVGFAASAGQTYYLMVSTTFGGGAFSFAVKSFPLLNIGLTVDGTSHVDSKTGLATITGTVTSSEPVAIGLAGIVQQRNGKKYLVSGSFGEDGEPPVVVQCPGQATWSAQVLGDAGNFGSGTAMAQVAAGAYDPASGQTASAQGTNTVQLRGSNK